MPDTMIQSPVASVTMPVEIARAIGEVMASVRSLPKSETNDHGGYQFASIDAFLAFVGPLCSTSGLIVLQDEDSIDLLERAGKTWAKITYSFTLAHTSGVMWNRPILRTVFQRVDGPQTTGGTQSYALKMFLRSIFQIPTGERDDPDYHAKEDMPAAALPAPQKAAQRAEQPRRADPTPQTAQATQEAPGDSGEPQHMPIQTGPSGLLVGRWTRAALEMLDGKPEAWRRQWLELHEKELDDVRVTRPDYADKVSFAGIAPDLAREPAP